jgi:transmembrane sensor
VFYYKNAPNSLQVEKNRLTSLLHAYFSDKIDPEDTKELLDYISTADQHELSKTIDEVLPSYSRPDNWNGERLSMVYSRILEDERFTSDTSRERRSFSRYLAVAASIVLIVSIGISFYYFFGGGPSADIPRGVSTNKIVPGYDHAVLALGKDQLIHLDRASKVNTTFAGARILQQNNVLSYLSVNTVHYQPAINTLTTPKGGQFALVLEDGTKVWMNAASQLRYPTVFEGSERLVELIGEAYFEVAKDSTRPFKVKVDGTTVQVLGTHFNISAYQDQHEMETTLLEGSVRLVSRGKDAMLKPGEEARVTGSDGAISVGPADVGQATAWRKGLISFKDQDIAAIMKKISRSYDVEIVFTKAPGKQLFGGTLNRTRPLTELLRNLEILCDIKFKIEGRRIVVME